MNSRLPRKCYSKATATLNYPFIFLEMMGPAPNQSSNSVLYDYGNTGFFTNNVVDVGGKYADPISSTWDGYWQTTSYDKSTRAYRGLCPCPTSISDQDIGWSGSLPTGQELFSDLENSFLLVARFFSGPSVVARPKGWPIVVLSEDNHAANGVLYFGGHGDNNTYSLANFGMSVPGSATMYFSGGGNQLSNANLPNVSTRALPLPAITMFGHENGYPWMFSTANVASRYGGSVAGYPAHASLPPPEVGFTLTQNTKLWLLTAPSSVQTEISVGPYGNGCTAPNTISHVFICRINRPMKDAVAFALQVDKIYADHTYGRAADIISRLALI